MKNFFRSLLAIFLPWVIILGDDNPGGAFFALALQVSLIGWIPASFWAWRIVHQHPTEKTKTSPPSPPQQSSQE